MSRRSSARSSFTRRAGSRTDPGASRRLNLKRTVPAALAASLAFALAAVPAAPAGRANPLDDLARLCRDSRYFELRDAVARRAGDPSPALDFYRGAVDVAFTRLGPAVDHLRGCLDGPAGDPAPALARAARQLLADAYGHAGRYRDAAETLRTLLDSHGPRPDAAERTALENRLLLWSALAEVPPQTVEILGNSVIRMDDRHIPVGVMGRTLSLGYDTGANLSILFLSAADELGLPLLGPAVKVQSATGRLVEARATVVPELRIGEAVVRNAVFLVFPDNFLPPQRFRAEAGRHGLLGAPVLAALREFTETRDGLFLIPVSPRSRPVQNMCFSGFTPVVELVHRWVSLPFALDTGSGSTILHPPFLNRYRGEIKGRSEVRTTVVDGVGDAKTVRVRVLDEFDFKVGGLSLALLHVPVQEQVTNSCTRLFYGTLGLDILAQCGRMTFNFESMSFVLE